MQEQTLMQKQSAEGAKVLFIIAQNDFRDEELLEPKKILENAGFQVDVASISTNTATGMLGTKVRPDVAVKDANMNDYAALVVVGGSGSPGLRNHKEVLDLINSAEGKLIGGICLGPMALAKAGVLQGKRATVFKTDESVSELEDGGAIYTGNTIEVDGNIVTADGPAAAREFGEKLLEKLS